MTQSPSGPPPGYGPPPGPQGPVSPNAPTQNLPLTGPPPEHPGAAGPGAPNFPAPPRPDAKTHMAAWVLGLLSLVATVIGLSVDEDGRNAWDSVHAWGGVAILGALLTAAPAVRSALKISSHRAWQVAACGAGALALFWVLFVLPAAGSNTSLVLTVGAAAGLIAAWVAPGREADDDRQPPVW